MGVPLHIDNSTLIGNFNHFARLLVDVDLLGALPETLAFELDNMWSYVSVMYENLLIFYLVCNYIGQAVVDCLSLDRGKKKVVRNKMDKPSVKQVLNRKIIPRLCHFPSSVVNSQSIKGVDVQGEPIVDPTILSNHFGLLSPKKQAS